MMTSAQRPGHVRCGLDHGRAGASGACYNERASRVLERFGDLSRKHTNVVRKVWNWSGCGIELMRHGKAKPGEIGGRAAERACCHVVEPCRVWRGNKEWTPFLLRGIAHGCV